MNTIKDWRNDEQLIADLARMRDKRLRQEGRYEELALIAKRRRYREIQRKRIRRANVAMCLVVIAVVVFLALLGLGMFVQPQ